MSREAGRSKGELNSFVSLAQYIRTTSSRLSETHGSWSDTTVIVLLADGRLLLSAASRENAYVIGKCAGSVDADPAVRAGGIGKESSAIPVVASASDDANDKRESEVLVTRSRCLSTVRLLIYA